MAALTRNSTLTNSVSSPAAKLAAATSISADGFSSPLQKGLAGAIGNDFMGAGAVPTPRQPQQDVAWGAPAAPVGPSAAQTDPLLASLGSLDTVLTNKNNGSQDEYNRAIDGYNASDALDRTNYDTNNAQNETNYTTGNQAAMLNAANASSGLRGVLSSLRALGGSGMDIVKRLVGLAASSDTGAARGNFETNATGLNQAWSQTEQQGRQRRDDASATLENNKQNNAAQVMTSRQGIYEQLAGLHGAGTAKGNEYAANATALTAPLAATTKATVAPYARASSLFSPGALKTYLGGTQNLSASATGNSQAINSPLYVAPEKKDQISGIA